MPCVFVSIQGICRFIEQSYLFRAEQTCLTMEWE